MCNNPICKDKSKWARQSYEINTFLLSKMKYWFLLIKIY